MKTDAPVIKIARTNPDDSRLCYMNLSFNMPKLAAYRTQSGIPLVLLSGCPDHSSPTDPFDPDSLLSLPVRLDSQAKGRVAFASAAGMFNDGQITSCVSSPKKMESMRL